MDNVVTYENQRDFGHHFRCPVHIFKYSNITHKTLTFLKNQIWTKDGPYKADKSESDSYKSVKWEEMDNL